MAKATVLVGQGSRDFAHNLDDLFERWQLAHYPEDLPNGNDIRKMDNIQFSQYIGKAEISYLKELKKELDIINANVTAFLSKNHDATINPEKNLGYHEKGHYFSAIRVRKTCGAYSAAIQLEISNRPKQKHEFDKTVHSVFCDLIWDEEIIPHDKFKELFAKARKLYASQQSVHPTGAGCGR